jgi:L-2-hydroxyglutarate oxidase
VNHDVCVIGAGIVGLATAMALLEKQPGLDVVVVDKEGEPGRHQTGHNSGVIHAGIYYEPGSLKAELCRRGAVAIKDFATAHGIPYETTGKLVVATNSAELERMTALYERARINGVPVEKIDAAELRRRDANVTGVGALFVAETAIVDFAAVAAAMARAVVELGGELRLGEGVTAIKEDTQHVTVIEGGRAVQARNVVACAGLQADRVARLAGVDLDFRIVPFRGEYYRLPPSRNDLIRHLIYPVPDPQLPFLGVHLTRTLDGGVTVGPNAVLGLAREKYPKWSFDRRDFRDIVGFPGMWRLARQHWRTGLRELRNSLFRRGYLRECRKYCPSLAMPDLLPTEAGIRAQAVLRDGALVHDFLWVQTARTLHVCNAPSPAATSSIPIGEMIADRVLAQLRHRA